MGFPMERVGVDVVGPLPCREGERVRPHSHGLFYCVWPEAYALPDQETETIADALIEGMISHFGSAESIHSDHRAEISNPVSLQLYVAVWTCRRPVLPPCTPRVATWWSGFIAVWNG